MKFIVDQIADIPEDMDWRNVRTVANPIMAKKKGSPTLSLEGLTADNFKERVDPLVKNGYVTTTSMPVVYESEAEIEHKIMSIERLTKSLLPGEDVIYLAGNSTITTAYGMVSALYAGFDEKDYNGHQAVCVDTQCASTGLALLVRDLVAYSPGSVEDAVEFILENRGRIAHVFTWGDFTYIKNSGKVRALPAFLGKLLRSHPLCSVEYVGDERPLVAIAQAIRGERRFFEKFARFVRDTIVDFDGEIVVAHGDDPELAKKIEAAILEVLPRIRILHWRCGPVIQAHGGPTSIHVNYYRKSPNNYQETIKLLK